MPMKVSYANLARAANFVKRQNVMRHVLTFHT